MEIRHLQLSDWCYEVDGRRRTVAVIARKYGTANLVLYFYFAGLDTTALSCTTVPFFGVGNVDSLPLLLSRIPVCFLLVASTRLHQGLAFL